jgi:hypothetical protein
MKTYTIKSITPLGVATVSKDIGHKEVIRILQTLLPDLPDNWKIEIEVE